jgi:hypothetical protein
MPESFDDKLTADATAMLATDLGELGAFHVSPLVVDGIGALREHWPELLNKHRGQWVAYLGRERLGFGASSDDLYSRYAKRASSVHDLLVVRVSEGLPFYIPQLGQSS